MKSNIYKKDSFPRVYLSFLIIQVLIQAQQSSKTTFNYNFIIYHPSLLSRQKFHFTATMQFPLIATVLAVFATSAIADNCTPGLNYCGKTLMAVGKNALPLFVDLRTNLTVFAVSREIPALD